MEPSNELAAGREGFDILHKEGARQGLRLSRPTYPDKLVEVRACERVPLVGDERKTLLGGHARTVCGELCGGRFQERKLVGGVEGIMVEYAGVLDDDAPYFGRNEG